MSDVAIRVEGIGKRYAIGGAPREYGMLRESLIAVARAPFDRMRGRRPPESNEFWALRDVSFDLKQGEVLGIIGRNGAGKSTLLKILSRITEPTAGRALIHGRIGSLLEVGTGFHPELTGRENIYLNGAILGMSKRDIDTRFDEIVAFSGIASFLDAPVKRYSSGMYMRLAFSVAAHLEPDILIVDEVLSVGDMEFQRKSLGKMEAVARDGRTVIFVSHNLAAVRSLCHRAAELRLGTLAQIGEVESIVGDYLQTTQVSWEARSDLFPATNSAYGVSIERCSASVDRQPDDNRYHRLIIEVDIQATSPLRHIGVGFSLTASDGAVVSKLGPAVTNFVIDRVVERQQCTIVCDQVDKYLVGGTYSIGVWISLPRTEILVSVDDVVTVSLPPSDPFSSGSYIESPRNGVVALPARFESDDQHIQADHFDEFLSEGKLVR